MERCTGGRGRNRRRCTLWVPQAQGGYTLAAAASTLEGHSQSDPSSEPLETWITDTKKYAYFMLCFLFYVTACAYKSTSSIKTVRSHVVSISPWLSEDVFVKGLLSAGQPAFEDVLVLLGQLFLHVPFGTPQDEGLDHLHLKV